MAWPQQLVDELKRLLAARGWKLEWDVIRQDLAALAQVGLRDEFFNLAP